MSLRLAIKSYLLVALTIGATSLTQADPPSVSQPAQITTAHPEACNVDEFWIVSTRSLGCDPGVVNPLRDASFKRCIAGGTWQPSAFSQLTEKNVALTCVFVHGNRIPCDDVVKRGMWVYRKLRCGMPDNCRMKFVMWSWPTSPKEGPLRDARRYLGRSDVESFYLGCFLSHLDPDQRVSLAGFSLGAKVIAGSFHLMAGGTLNGRALSNLPPRTVQPRATFFAAAIHDNWLHRGNRLELATVQADKILTLFNTKDPALRRYWAIYRGEHPTALGYSGVRNRSHLTNPAVYCERNVSGSVGKEHALKAYLDSDVASSLMRYQMLWKDDPVDIQVVASSAPSNNAVP